VLSVVALAGEGGGALDSSGGGVAGPEEGGGREGGREGGRGGVGAGDVAVVAARAWDGWVLYGTV